MEFAATLASYADIYVNDAFGTAHRAHASTVGIAKLLPAYAGLLMERELTMLSKLLQIARAAVRGDASAARRWRQDRRHRQPPDEGRAGARRRHGEHLPARPGQDLGKSLAEAERAEAAAILATAGRQDHVVLPIDVIVAKEVARGARPGAPGRRCSELYIVDLGKQGQDLMVDALSDAKTVFWNGPLGVFGPSFAHGANAVARMLADRADQGATARWWR